MPCQVLTQRPFIRELRQNFSAAITTVGGDGQKFIGQKASRVFAVDEPAGAKGGFGIGDMLGHHLPKRGIGNQTFGKITARFRVSAKGQDQLGLFARVDCGFRAGEFRLFAMFEHKA